LSNVAYTKCFTVSLILIDRFRFT